MKKHILMILTLCTTSYCMQPAIEVQLINQNYTLQESETWPSIPYDTALKMGSFNNMMTDVTPDTSEPITVSISGTLASIKTFANLLSQEKEETLCNITPPKLCEITNIANNTQANNLQKLLVKHMCEELNEFKPYLSKLNSNVRKIVRLKTLTQDELDQNIMPHKCEAVDISHYRTIRYYNPLTQTILSYGDSATTNTYTRNLTINNVEIEISNKPENIVDILLAKSNKEETLFLCQAGRHDGTLTCLLLHKISTGFRKYKLPYPACCLIPNQPYSFFSVQDKTIMYYDHMQEDAYGLPAQGKSHCDISKYFENSQPSFISTNDKGNIIAVSDGKKIIIITEDKDNPIVKELENIITQDNQQILLITFNHKGDKLVYIAATVTCDQKRPQIKTITDPQCALIDLNDAKNKRIGIRLPYPFGEYGAVYNNILDAQFSPQDDWLTFYHDEAVYYYHISTGAHFKLPARHSYECVSSDCSAVIQNTHSKFNSGHKKIPVLEIIEKLSSDKEIAYTTRYRSNEEEVGIDRVINKARHAYNIVKYTFGVAVVGLLFVLIKRCYSTIAFH